MDQTIRRPAGRYDEPRPLPRGVTAVLVLAVGAFLLLLVLRAYDRFGPDDIQSRLLGYTVVDDRTVEVRFEVRTDPGTSVTCRLRALGADMREVASEQVRVGPSDEDRIVTSSTLTTSARAASSEVVGCRP